MPDRTSVTAQTLTASEKRDRQRLRAIFEANTETVWRHPDIVKALTLRGKAAKRLPLLLRQMVRDGEIVELRPGVFGIGKSADLITGRIDVMRSGNARVTDPDGDAPVWIQPEDQSTALPGDTVLVRKNAEPGGKYPGSIEGRVVRIIARAKRDIVGTLQSTGRFYYVVPIDPVYKQDFYVPPHPDAKIGYRVVVRFIDWPNRHVNPEGEIVDVLGPADKPSLDTETIIRQYDLPRAFPEPVIREADLAVDRMKRPGRREDCRDLMILTIDPERARDFDDALSLQRVNPNQWELGVHIADVSHFVRPGSALDTEARERGTSVYLPDLVLPMLPEQLSNGVCSLRPNEDRLGFSVFMTLDAQGTVIRRRFSRTRIRSRLRLTYEQAMGLIEGKHQTPASSSTTKILPAKLPEGTLDLLKNLHDLTQKIRAKRFQDHALELDLPECEILINAEGRMTGVRPVIHDASHQMIEECMVLANEAVATELQGNGIRIISRLHEPPDPEKIDELTAELKSLGFHPGDLSTPRHVARFLAGLCDHPLRQHAHMLVLRSMKRAIYAVDDHGHYGLGKTHYAHFTSPIRRYPDLTLHRQVADYLTGRPQKAAAIRGLKADALHCSEREQRAEEASRAILEIKKYRYLQQQLDDQQLETYTAVIAKVTNFGCFIDVTDLQISGLVHVSAMSDNFVRHDSADASLSADGKTYRVGQPLQVQVVKVDFNQRRADFKLVDSGLTPPPDRRGSRRTHTGKPRRKGQPGRKQDTSGPRSAKVHRR